jgi:alcohol dehydrogenase class IV
MQQGDWSYSTGVRFGARRLSELPDACAQVGIANPLLVTDRGLASLPVTLQVLDILDAAGLGRALFRDCI